MGLIKRIVTPEIAAANRVNARRSSGPRTPEGKRHSSFNALKHGRYSDALFESMRKLEEDPLDFTRLLDDHPLARTGECGRGDAGGRHRRAALAQISQRAGTVRHGGRAMEKLQLEHERRVKELNRELTSAPQAEVLKHGLYKLEDTPGKFEKILSLLKDLLQQVRAGNFLLDAEPVLTMLYGEEPSLRGVYFTNVFRRLHRLSTEEAQESDEAGPGEEASSPTELDGAEAHNTPSTPFEREILDLEKELLQEARIVNEAYQHFLKQYVVATPAQKDACFAPHESEWRALRLQESAIDRQIERKTKLLMEMQEQAEKREARQVSKERASQKQDRPAGAPRGLKKAKRMFFVKRTRQLLENKRSASENMSKRTPNEPQTNPGFSHF